MGKNLQFSDNFLTSTKAIHYRKPFLCRAALRLLLYLVQVQIQLLTR